MINTLCCPKCYQQVHKDVGGNIFCIKCGQQFTIPFLNPVKKEVKIEVLQDWHRPCEEDVNDRGRLSNADAWKIIKQKLIEEFG